METMPNDQIEILKECFDNYDSDGMGMIPKTVCDVILHLMGYQYNPTKLDEEFKDCCKKHEDKDGSGQIEFEEFIVLCSRFMEEEPEDNAVVMKELKEIFNLYDKDDVGFMTCSVLRAIIAELDPTLGDEELDDIIDEVDEDGSGTVDFEEFTKMMIG